MLTLPAPRAKRKTSQLGLRNAWKTEFNRVVDDSGVSRSFKSGLEEFSFKRNALAKNFTPHQLANLAGCNSATIYRNLQKALDAGLIVLVQPGDHSQRKAALFRLAEDFPTFQEYQIATVEDVTATIEDQKNPRFTGGGCSLVSIPLE